MVRTAESRSWVWGHAKKQKPSLLTLNPDFSVQIQGRSTVAVHLIVIPLLSTAVGAYITWYVSKHYYERAGQDLEVEAAELRRLNTLILRGLEEAGLVEWNRDKRGRVLGVIINMTARGTLSSSASIKMTKNDEDNRPADQNQVQN